MDQTVYSSASAGPWINVIVLGLCCFVAVLQFRDRRALASPDSGNLLQSSSLLPSQKGAP